MSIKALFLDDEPLALRQLEMYATKIPDLKVLGFYQSAEKARPMIEQADVLFADINMPDVNGLDFVRSLAQPPLIVFTTAYAQYAVEGFRVNAVDYLLKPFSFKEFQASVERVSQILAMQKAAQKEEQPDFLHFKTDYKTVRVPLENIAYIESMSEYVKIWIDGENAPLVVLYSLKHLVEQLPPEKFMRIHRSYIISLSHIESANSSSASIHAPGKKEPVALPVSESYRAAFREYLASH